MDLNKIKKVPKDGPSQSFRFRDKTYLFNEYGLTKNGEPICVEKYCILLANQKSTHVVLFKDNRTRSRWGVEIIEDDITWEWNFNELKLKDYSGMARFQAWYYDCYPLLIE